MTRIEQAFARRKLQIEGRSFMEIHGAGIDAITQYDVDTQILADECLRLYEENERLKRGDFTEEEFQNLFHKFSPSDESRFKQGCIEYQEKLFGKKLYVCDRGDMPPLEIKQ